MEKQSDLYTGSRPNTQWDLLVLPDEHHIDRGQCTGP